MMIDDLKALTRMPTVASCRPALDEAAAWLTLRLHRMGAHRIPVPHASAPIVAAERRGPPGAPTVLVYGHYDVIPPGPGWSTPPFASVRKGQTLHGRGTSDDKGPIVAVLHGLDRPAPVRLKFLFEGEEEIGSPSLAGAIEHLRDWLADVDAILVCDTASTAAGRPTLTCALRGDLTAELTATGLGRALHSGRHGGLVPNPVQAVAELVASLHHEDGRVAIPGFYDSVRANRPAVVVTSLCAGECGRGPWHVIPATASAQLNLRLVDEQRPTEIERLLRNHIAAHTPRGIRCEIKPLVHIDPWQLRTLDHPAVRAACTAVRHEWGVRPALVRSGGSINAVPLLAAAAPRAAVLLLGFTLPSDNAHGANEHVDISRLARASRTVARLIELLQ